tara:strand:- start:294 stop:524 length:231 start_codon:yes stop_codon:yes gene_type:complete
MAGNILSKKEWDNLPFSKKNKMSSKWLNFYIDKYEGGVPSWMKDYDKTWRGKSQGGLVKNYVNPVTIVDNLKKKRK